MRGMVHRVGGPFNYLGVRIEAFFPADEATEAASRRLARA
jgi:hypothetical protein